MSTATLDSKTAAQRATSKFLTFVLGDESYGIPVLKIREIIRMTDITAVPRMPEYIKGVINLRGKVIPIVDLRMKFGLPNVAATERTCIVVVQVTLPNGNSPQMGLIVDAVEEVLNINGADIEATPDFGGRVDTEYMIGMAKVRNAVKTLLDIDKIVSAESLVRVAAAA
jgi:purine-binding chemotaxis protein CheW